MSESETARSPVWGSRNERSSQTRSGEVAQSVEHAAENRGVGGSIPPLPTDDQPRQTHGKDGGNDHIDGGNGNDTLDGGTDTDTIHGGADIDPAINGENVTNVP